MQQALRRPLGNFFAPYGTPLHVRDMFVEFLKRVFISLPEEYPYHFVDDFEATDVVIDVAYNKKAQIYGSKPIIIVSRGSQQFEQTAVGDLSTARYDISKRTGVGVVSSSISITVGSNEMYEAEVLSQLIFSVIVGYRVFLPAILGIHSINGLSLTDVPRQDQDDQAFWATIIVPFTQQYHWKVRRDDPVLLGYNLGFNAVYDGEIVDTRHVVRPPVGSN